MNGINRVFLMGYLGNEPEAHQSKSGKTYVRLNLATHYSKKLDNGDRQDTTEWHRIMVFGKTADRCREHLHTGDTFAVEGYLSNYTHEREEGGTPTKTTSIVAQQVHFLGKRPRPAEEPFAPAP